LFFIHLSPGDESKKGGGTPEKNREMGKVGVSFLVSYDGTDPACPAEIFT